MLALITKEAYQQIQKKIFREAAIPLTAKLLNVNILNGGTWSASFQIANEVTIDIFIPLFLYVVLMQGMGLESFKSC